MTDPTTIGSGTGSAGSTVATGGVDSDPITPDSEPPVESTTGNIGMPQGSYGIESVVSAALELDSPESAAPAAPVAAEPPLDVPPNTYTGVSAGVGPNQPNHKADVKMVQQRLADLGYPVDVDGYYGPQTGWYISLFASITIGMERVYLATKIIKPDNFLDLHLTEDTAPTWEKVPSGGAGWTRVDNDGYGYGARDSIEVIERAGKRYADGYQATSEHAPDMMINDLSRRDGSVLTRYGREEHATHRNGLDVDLRLPRKPGYPQTGSKTNWASYDRDATYAMIDALASDDRVERIIIYDPTILAWAERDEKAWIGKLHATDKGHRDHLHVDVKAPSAE